MKQKIAKTEQFKQAKEAFELVCKEAGQLHVANNAASAFIAVDIVTKLRGILSKEVMENVFMPLMNTKIGFLTDRKGKPDKRGHVKPLYSIEIVRDALIDGIMIGLLPTGNQINIIADQMYPTKEGFTFLLKTIGVKYFINAGFDKGENQNFAVIPVKISYEHNGEKNSFSIEATVKKDNYSSHDQLRGKAERRGKKALYEYITGCDFGDADEESSVVDAAYEDVSDAVDLKDMFFKDTDEAKSWIEKANGLNPGSLSFGDLDVYAKKSGIKIIIKSNVDDKKNKMGSNQSKMNLP